MSHSVPQPKISTSDAISHEFRTPLAVMLQCATLLRDEADAQGRAEQVRLIDMILDRGDDLDALIDQWLATRGPTGGRWHPQPTPLEQLVEPLRRLLERKSALRHRQLAIEIAASPETMVYCDVERTRRTMLQLGSFLLRRPAEDGPIKLAVTLDAADESLRLTLGPATTSPRHAIPAQLGPAWKRLLDGQPTWGLQLIERGLATQFGRLQVNEFPEVSLQVTLSLAQPTALVHHHLAQWQSRAGRRPLTLLRLEVPGIEPRAANALTTLLDAKLRRREWSLSITGDQWLVMLERSPARVELFRTRIDQWMRRASRRAQGVAAPALNWTVVGSLSPGAGTAEFIDALHGASCAAIQPAPCELPASPTTPLIWQP
jgi:hypothetical protein